MKASLFVGLVLIVAFVAGLVWFLFGLRCPGGPTRLLVGLAEVGAIACRQVSVVGAQFAVTCGRPTVCACFLAVATSHSGQRVARLGLPVSLLSAQITLIGAFNADLDAGIGLDGIQLVQDRLLVALTLVGFRLAPVGSAITLVGSVITPTGLPVPLLGDVVARVGHPVTLVGETITPISHTVTLVGAARALFGLGSHRASLPQRT